MTVNEIVETVIEIIKLLLSWPVVFFIIVLFFKKQLIGIFQIIFERMTKIKTPFVEFELEPKIVKTNLGQTEISKVTVKQSVNSIAVIEGFQGMYIGDNFIISWPSKKWDGDTEAAKNTPKLIGIEDSDKRKFSIFIGSKENIKDFKPNVNVLLELTTINSMKQIIPIIIDQYTRIGWQIISTNIDEDDQAGFVEYKNINDSLHLYQFQRFVLAFGRLYVVTASVPIPTNPKEYSIIEDLSLIVNSFRIIV